MQKEELYNKLKTYLLKDEAFLESVKALVGAKSNGVSEEDDEALFGQVVKTALTAIVKKEVNVDETVKPYIKSITPAYGAEALVPSGFIPKLVEKVKSVGLMRRLATVMPVGSATGYLPKVIANPPVLWQGETTDTSASATYQAVQWYLRTVITTLAIPRSVVDYSPINLARFVAKQMALAIAKDEDDTFFANQNEGSRPLGLVPQIPDTNKISVGDSGITYDAIAEAISRVYAQEASFGQNAVFVVSPVGLANLAQVKDTVGRPIFQQVLTSENECCLAGMVLGRKVYVSSALAQLDGQDSSGNPIGTILVGDFSQAVIFLGNKMTFEISKDAMFAEHMLAMKLTEDKDFRVLYPEAFAIISA